MQRGESVTSDPRKALSRCLGQEEAGQAGTAVTLKLAQPLHMPQEATASTCLPQLGIPCPGVSRLYLPGAAGDLGTTLLNP